MESKNDYDEKNTTKTITTEMSTADTERLELLKLALQRVQFALALSVSVGRILEFRAKSRLLFLLCEQHLLDICRQ